MNKLKTHYANGDVIEHTYEEFADVCSMKMSTLRKAVSRGTITKKMANAGVVSFTKVVNVKSTTGPILVWIYVRDGYLPNGRFNMVQSKEPIRFESFEAMVKDPKWRISRRCYNYCKKHMIIPDKWIRTSLEHYEISKLQFDDGLVLDLAEPRWEVHRVGDAARMVPDCIIHQGEDSAITHEPYMKDFGQAVSIEKMYRTGKVEWHDLNQPEPRRDEGWYLVKDLKTGQIFKRYTEEEYDTEWFVVKFYGTHLYLNQYGQLRDISKIRDMRTGAYPTRENHFTVQGTARWFGDIFGVPSTVANNIVEGGSLYHARSGPPIERLDGSVSKVPGTPHYPLIKNHYGIDSITRCSDVYPSRWKFVCFRMPAFDPKYKERTQACTENVYRIIPDLEKWFVPDFLTGYAMYEHINQYTANILNEKPCPYAKKRLSMTMSQWFDMNKTVLEHMLSLEFLHGKLFSKDVADMLRDWILMRGYVEMKRQERASPDFPPEEEARLLESGISY